MRGKRREERECKEEKRERDSQTGRRRRAHRTTLPHLATNVFDTVLFSNINVRQSFRINSKEASPAVWDKISKQELGLFRKSWSGRTQSLPFSELVENVSRVLLSAMPVCLLNHDCCCLSTPSNEPPRLKQP